VDHVGLHVPDSAQHRQMSTGAQPFPPTCCCQQPRCCAASIIGGSHLGTRRHHPRRYNVFSVPLRAVVRLAGVAAATTARTTVYCGAAAERTEVRVLSLAVSARQTAGMAAAATAQQL
jgi:hypothetical protein